jgi:hypothetical protein
LKVSLDNTTADTTNCDRSEVGGTASDRTNETKFGETRNLRDFRHEKPFVERPSTLARPTESTRPRGFCRAALCLP